MKTLIKTKLTFHNDRKYCELRSYEVKNAEKIKVINCIDSDYRTHDHSDEEYMVLTASQLKKGVVVNTQKSKFPPYENYLLLEYVWKPKKDSKEAEVPNVMQAMVKSSVWEELRKKRQSWT